MSEIHYKAFISYSHQDEKFATWLHKKLETYKVPKELQEDYPELPKKLFPLFRDREELSTSSDLGTEILKALQHSEYLIVICSPNSAKSQWVNQEIIDFKKIHGEKKIHAIIIDGEPHAKDSDKFDDDLECFPEALKYQVDEDGNLTDIHKEPIAGDLRKGKDGKELGKLKLIAGLLGVKFDELNRREEKRNKRKRLVWSLVVALLFVVMAGLTLFSFKQMNKAIQSEKTALEEKARAEDNKREAEKQLIIAANKTQSLSILTTKTIQALTLADEDVLKKYLEGIFESGERDIFIEMIETLIEKTNSMDDDEKQYWHDILPAISNEHLSNLVKVLMVESQKLKKLDDELAINNKEVKQWMIRFQQKTHNSCFLGKKARECLRAAHFTVEYSDFFDNNLSVDKYFVEYNNLIKTPSSFYYLVYSEYLKKQGKRDESFKHIKKSVSMKPSDIDSLQHLIKYYKEDNNLTETLKIQKRIVFYRKEDYLKVKDSNETERNREETNLISALEELFSFQYKMNSKNIISELYPKYEKDLIFLKARVNKDSKLDDYLKIYSYISSSYANIKDYRNAVKFLKKLLQFYYKSPKRQDVKQSWIAEKHLSLAWYQLILGNYQEAIENSKKGIKLDINKALSLETNLAHAYLLSGDFENAKFIYMKNEKKRFKDGELWEDVILKDFEILKKEGIKSNDFKKIEKLLYGENPMVVKFKDNKFYFYYKKNNKLCFTSDKLPSWKDIQKNVQNKKI